MALISISDIWEKADVGDWAFDGGEQHLIIRLPADNYSLAALGLRGRCPDKVTWEWNGSMESPTLTPSILHHGVGGDWHGYLTAGKLTQV